MKFLIAGHGEYPQGVYNTLKFFKDDLENVEIISTDNPDFERRITELVQTNLNNELVVITDLMAGSANLFAAKLLKDFHFHLICGVNVALLLELIFADIQNKAELVEIIEMAREQMAYVNDMMGKQYAQIS